MTWTGIRCVHGMASGGGKVAARRQSPRPSACIPAYARQPLEHKTTAYRQLRAIASRPGRSSTTPLDCKKLYDTIKFRESNLRVAYEIESYAS